MKACGLAMAFVLAVEVCRAQEPQVPQAMPGSATQRSGRNRRRQALSSASDLAILPSSRLNNCFTRLTQEKRVVVIHPLTRTDKVGLLGSQQQSGYIFLGLHGVHRWLCSYPSPSPTRTEKRKPVMCRTDTSESMTGSRLCCTTL